MALALAVLIVSGAAAADPIPVLHPERMAPGDIGWLVVPVLAADAAVQGVMGDRPLAFFEHGAGRAALVGIDLEVPPGPLPWTVVVADPQGPPRVVHGVIQVVARSFTVQRLTVPPSLADPDPVTARRALDESDRLRALYRTTTPTRLWRGPFVRPVPGESPGTGFGARRIINGKPRLPHAGIDFAAPWGTPVVAVNTGRVALVAEFYFPGRLVVIDHGLELYSLYFHLDTVSVAEHDRVDRGQRIGTVGATGRATGPHLHLGVQLGSARVDPAALLRLPVAD